MADIFISYAREDGDKAERLALALETAGYTCWWDRHLASGSRYLIETEAELMAAKAVVVIWSQASIASHWVTDEAAVGRDRNRLAAISFDGSMPPLGFRQFQVTDFSAWQGDVDEPAFRNLLSGLARLAAPRTDGAPTADKRSKSNLPSRLDALIGREAELAEIAALLADWRLVTLTGPGGIGKTRLAVEAARATQDDYVDGVRIVSLAGLSDPGEVSLAISQALGIETEEKRASGLLGRLPLWRTLIVLDNCEHLIEAAAGLVEEMLQRAPDLRILATSQEILGLEGERIVRLRPLTAKDATALFMRCARGADPSFAPDETETLAIQGICERLDGIALAIEMAGARAPVLGCREMLRLLDDRFRVLTAGRRTALPRQRTLQATLDWSHGLLEPGDAKVFRRLAVFAGGCTLDAASGVTADAETPTVAVADAIGRLASKSLIVVDRGLTSARYRLLETMRAYAQQKLFEAGETDALQQRHAGYYARLFEPCFAEFWGDSSEAMLLSRYGAELDNLARALDWAFGPDGEPALGARLAADAGAILAFHGLFLDLARWSGAGLSVLGASDPPEIRDRLQANILIASVFVGGDAGAAAIADIADRAHKLTISNDWAARISALVVQAWALGAVAVPAALDTIADTLTQQKLPAISRAGCFVDFARVLAIHAAKGDEAETLRTCAQAALVKARAIGADQIATNVLAWGTTAEMPWEHPDAAIDPARALLEKLLAHTGYRMVRVSVAQLAGRFIIALVQRGRPGDLAEARAMAQTIEQRSVRVPIHLYRVGLAWLAWGDRRPRDAARLLGLLDQSGLTDRLLAADRRALIERLVPDLSPGVLDAALKEGSTLTWDEAFGIAVGPLQ